MVLLNMRIIVSLFVIKRSVMVFYKCQFCWTPGTFAFIFIALDLESIPSLLMVYAYPTGVSSHLSTHLRKDPPNEPSNAGPANYRVN